MSPISLDPLSERSIINYRFDQQKNALGAYCVILSLSYEADKIKFSDQIDSLFESIENTLITGFRRVRTIWVEENHPELLPRSNPEFRKKRNELANRDAKKRIDEMRKNLSL